MASIEDYTGDRLTSDDLLLFKYLGYKDMTEDEKDDFWRELPDSEKYSVNQLTTKVNGFGEDRLYCNESSRVNFKFEDFENLLDWDIACWNQQREWRLADEYQPFDKGEYKFNTGMTGEWIRLIEKSRLLYGTIYSLHSFLWWKMEDLVFDIENELIPHEFKWEPPIDKTDECCGEEESCGDECGCRRVKININAFGREEEYEKIRKLTYDYISTGSRGDKIIEEISKDHVGTFRIDSFENPYDPYSDFIVCDKETLGKIRPRFFLDDFNSFIHLTSWIDELIIKLKVLIDKDFREYVKENM